MKLKNVIIALATTVGLIAPVSAVSAKAINVKALTSVTLNIYNWEDYMYESDEKDGSAPSVINQFVTYAASELNLDVNVNYTTFSTNEDMYNAYALGKGNYDLIAPSEYMIMRMIREDMLQELNYDLLPNYKQYASHYFQHALEEVSIDKYTAGYMWGTVGLVYNPLASSDTTKMHEDMKSWSSLWNPTYKGLISIKDSMRDTYLIALGYIYQHELTRLNKWRSEGLLTNEQYNEELTSILNRTDDLTLSLVDKALQGLKQNYFGLEVDSGKNDMITGKVAINTAWSGDAVYAMDTAEEETGVELYYSLPSEGSNIWFDGWVIPKNAKNVDVAHHFIDFVSQPEIAALNMDYIGYTSAIAGDAVFEQVKDWYEASPEEIDENSILVDLTYFFEGTVSEGKDLTFYSNYVGRQLTAQYPSAEEISRLVIMQDFGDRNDAVIAIWTSFKSTTLTWWVWLVLILVAILIAIYIIRSVIKKQKSARHSRRRKAKA